MNRKITIQILLLAIVLGSPSSVLATSLGTNADGVSIEYFDGNVGINDTDPKDRLVVVGTINGTTINGSTISGASVGAGVLTAGVATTSSLKITGGSPGANKVLTSDGAGNATWQPLPIVGSVANATSAINADNATTANMADSLSPAGLTSVQTTISTLDALSNIGAVGTTTTVDGNLSVLKLISGNGGGLTNVNGSSINGAVALALNTGNATTANTADLATFATNAGNASTANSATSAATVTVAAQPAITSLANLISAGNISSTLAIVNGASIGDELNVTGKSSLLGPVRLTSSSVTGQVLTAADNLGNAQWQTLPASINEYTSNGDIAGADRLLGNLDDQGLSLITNGVAAITIDDNGYVGFNTTTLGSRFSLADIATKATMTLTDKTFSGVTKLNAHGYYNGNDDTAGLALSGPGNQGINITSAGHIARISAVSGLISFKPEIGYATTIGNWLLSTNQLLLDTTPSAGHTPITATVNNSQAANVISIGKASAPGGMLTMNSTGSVGIGTTNPGRFVDISYTEPGPTRAINYLRLTANSALGAYHGTSVIEGYYSDSGNGSRFTHSQIKMEGTSVNSGAANSIGEIVFLTKSDTGNVADLPTEKVRVTSDGKLHIGSVYQPSGLDGDLSFYGIQDRLISVGANPGTNVIGRDLTVRAGNPYLSSSNLAGGTLNLSGGKSTGSGTSQIQFQTASAGPAGNAVVAPTTKMTILGSGNVGVGTTTPAYKLDVQGDINASPLLNLRSGGNLVLIDDGAGVFLGNQEVSKPIFFHANDTMALRLESISPAGGPKFIGPGSTNLGFMFDTDAQNTYRLLEIRNNGVLKNYVDRNGALAFAEAIAPTETDGFGKLYVKPDSKLYYKNDTGTEYSLTGSGALGDPAGDTNIAGNTTTIAGSLIATPAVGSVTNSASLVASKTIMRVTGTGVPGLLTDLSSISPQIAAGVDGQILIIRCMLPDTQRIKFYDGRGLDLGSASITLNDKDTLTLVYDAVLGVWVEVTRSLN